MSSNVDTELTSKFEAEEPVEQQREPQTKHERGVGTVHEAGRNRQYIFSSTDMVHKRPPLKSGDGYALDPVCGQTLTDNNVWGGIDADNPEEVATKYEKTQFCSQCFSRSIHLSRLGKQAREEHRHE